MTESQVDRSQGVSQNITVVTGEGACTNQPDTFRLCPLGIQFYSPKPWEECSILEFDLNLPGASTGETVTCSGFVADCCEARKDGMYRVWVNFLDLPNPVRERIRCTAEHSELLCPFCENF